MKAVEIISMFVKEKGPSMPMNYTVHRKLEQLGEMWERKFEKFFSMPFEKKDMEVSGDYLVI